jgi:hypothetical protein
VSDDFFTREFCKCGKHLTVRTMSRFSPEPICPECEEAEKLDPEYQKAADAELEACRRGDYNFPGIRG